MSDKVCGYTNFETFTVALYIDKNKYWHDYWYDHARHHVELELPASALASMIESWVRRHSDFPSLDGLARELLGVALNTADWLDVAETIMTSVQEELAYQEVG